ncbi:hypothetical protein BZA70DRAFT_266597 [Myxozyma melibiosi]|uniref:Ceramide very long chain fatty acid hydroxylase n=1 Tax=Myxozyma melibiosi TaxID=54550 RepID=A0ABR1F916_9ASCO
MAPSLPLMTATELAVHTSARSAYISLNNRKIYDVTSFLDQHPGGSELILQYAGKDATDIMADLVSHEHSESAYEMLDEMLVAILATPEEEAKLLDGVSDKDAYLLTGISTEEDLSITTDFEVDYKKNKFLDLSKPLFLQVLFADFDKAFYLEQVHRPRHYGNGSAPLFGNFMEPLSKTPWYVVPIVWLPCVAYGTYVASKGLSMWALVPLWCLGIFIWTFVEYMMHRMLFHIDDRLPDHSIALALHFLLHGVHHYLPMDKLRLVMPPSLFVILAFPFYRLAHALFPYYIALAIFCGGIFGYICYDCTHYFLHHASLPSYLKSVKTYHMEHHYKNYELGFGVTSKFWDVVFGTELVDTSGRPKVA